MPTLQDYAAASARLLFDRLTPRAPLIPAQIVADLGLVGDQPFVLVSGGGATRRALWAIPNAIALGRPVFVEAEAAGTDAPLFVVAPNYQAHWSGTWGNTVGTWGQPDGSQWGQGPPGAFDGP